MQIIDLDFNDENCIHQVAEMLVEGFKEMAPEAWPNMEDALEEVRESFGEGRLSRVAVDEEGRALGWIGGIRHYSGESWELHPMVVHPRDQRKGIGRALILDFEAQVKARRAVSIWLGSDDETNMTSLGGVDLYPNVLEKLANIKNLRNHPFEFYQKMGYTIVGVFPDANGFGKPDIFMAKRL